jgi:tRNA A37 threonylcarbamoyladenosine dehydratase
LMSSDPDSDYFDRFSGLGRLYGRPALDRLRRARVAVIGIGGVGTWAAEALARSGIGHLALIDLDEVCVTNVNRQIHALDGQIGRPKVGAMADRVRLISPGCEATPITQYFTEATAAELLSPGYDVVIDAIDNVKHKSLLIAECVKRSVPLIVSGGGGGKRDPTTLSVADLARATNDRLLKRVRKVLRRDHGFPDEPSKLDFGVTAVFCDEKAVYPWVDGTVCAEPEPGSELRLNCESGFGTAAFVTGAIGFAGAAEAVKCILVKSPASSRPRV